MNLLAETWRSSFWVARVTWRIMQVCWLRTFTLILTIAGKKLALLLAFFLPLKVILLAGSDGVPRYFQFFIDPAQKDPWIVGLSVGAVAFYLLSLLFEYAATRISESGTRDIATSASQYSVTSENLREMQGYYRKLSRVNADTLVLVLGLALIFWLDFVLFLTVGSLIFLFYLIPLVVLSRGDVLNPTRVMSFILNQTSVYLQIALAVTFLGGFFAILSSFIGNGEGNILIAILSLLLLRQVLAGLSSNAMLLSTLWPSRHQIEPLVFPERKIQSEQNKASRNLRLLFAPESRISDLAQALSLGGGGQDSVSSSYVDCSLSKIYLFRVELNTKDPESPTVLQQQVFAKKSVPRLEHEDFLFQYVSRSDFRAPSVRARYSVGPFECQVVDWPHQKRPKGVSFKSMQPEIMSFYWSISPPASLVRAFKSSHMMLEDRLSYDLLERLTVALDSTQLVNCFERFLGQKKRIAEVLKELPVFVWNPDLSASHVELESGGRWSAMIWHRWSLQYVGCGLPPSTSRDEIVGMIGAAAKERKWPDNALTPEYVLLARDCHEIEQSIKCDAFNKAIGLMADVLKNPVLEHG